MNIKMATNSQLSTSTIESKKTNYANRQNRNRIVDMQIIWRVVSSEGEGGKGQEFRSITGRYKIARGRVRTV